MAKIVVHTEYTFVDDTGNTKKLGSTDKEHDWNTVVNAIEIVKQQPVPTTPLPPLTP